MRGFASIPIILLVFDANGGSCLFFDFSAAAVFLGLKCVLKIVSKSIKNLSQIYPKSIKNRPQIYTKSVKNRPRIAPKLHPGAGIDFS